ncbi:MAG: hypothetical protein QNK37_19235 [Acidobacteriota bacterium]|nr:hypothetical protein [Acidobacteriota bacterium]
MLLLLFALCADIESFKVTVQPLPFEDEANPETHIKRIEQLDSAAGLIYILEEEPRILMYSSAMNDIFGIGITHPIHPMAIT